MSEFCPSCGIEKEKGKCSLGHNAKIDNWHSKAARDKAFKTRILLRLKLRVKEQAR